MVNISKRNFDLEHSSEFNLYTDIFFKIRLSHQVKNVNYNNDVKDFFITANVFDKNTTKQYSDSLYLHLFQFVRSLDFCNLVFSKQILFAHKAQMPHKHIILSINF